MQPIRAPSFSYLLTAVCVLAGCGGGTRTYPAGGRVTLADETSLAGGWVIFRSLSTSDGQDSTSARGLIQPDGTFKLTTFKSDDGAVLGKHQALVSLPILESEIGVKPFPFNLKFTRFETSGLEFTVTQDPEQNQFAITVGK